MLENTKMDPKVHIFVHPKMSSVVDTLQSMGHSVYVECNTDWDDEEGGSEGILVLNNKVCMDTTDLQIGWTTTTFFIGNLRFSWDSCSVTTFCEMLINVNPKVLS